MFDTLSDRIKQDEQAGTHKMELLVRWVVVPLIAFSLFGGLYLIVQRLE